MERGNGGEERVVIHASWLQADHFRNYCSQHSKLGFTGTKLSMHFRKETM